MTIVWVNLSTHWGLTSVQATVNVIISVLGTVGIWSFSRYWWQRGSASILCGHSEVPLATLFTLSSPSEGWDVVALLRRRIFAKENWHLLIQLFVVIAVTVACMFAGPIAKLSLRRTLTIQKSELEVLQAIKGDSYTANLLEANVLWNNTIHSLDEAGFPDNQMLDYLPPSTSPWIYVSREWNPTWTMACNYTTETVLHNVTSSGNYTFFQPIDAFPAYRDTYDASWLNKSMYRVQADFASWSVVEPSTVFKDVLFFILILPNPETDSRIYTNNETLQMSISVLHAQDFDALNISDVTLGSETSWRPVGPIRNTSFSRTECNITRKPQVADENAIPWLWTNDTYSITYAFRTYWSFLVEDNSSKGQPVSTPTPKDILRLYQAYMVSVNTIYALKSLKTVSIWMETVQLSTVFLGTIIVLTASTLWLTGRYFNFQRRHKAKLKELYVPDGKLEWMVHGAKIVANGAEEEMMQGKRAKDRDHFQTANFGYSKSESNELDNRLLPPRLARIYTSRTSTSRASPGSIRCSVSQCAPDRGLPVLDLHPEKEDFHELRQMPSCMDSHSEPERTVFSGGEKSKSCPRGRSPQPSRKMLLPELSSKSSADWRRHSFDCGTRSPARSFGSIVLEIEETPPINGRADSTKEKEMQKT